VPGMQAIRQHVAGPPETLVLEELPDPRPGEGQVRIAVEAAGVHLLDTVMRRGDAGGPFPPPELPMTPGREVAGVVDAVGPDVDPAWVGRRAVAHLGAAHGGYAELALAPVGALHELPRHLPPDVAVAMIGTGRTAMGILEVAAITADDLVVVPAAAGGLGALFVQAARRAGAGVVGLAGGEAKVELVRSLGADVAVDYRAEGWVERLRAELGDREPTLLLDGVGGEVARAAFDLLGPASRVVIFGWSSGEPLQLTTEDLLPRGVQVTPIGPRIIRRPGGWRDLEADALAAAADGTWTPLVTTFPLAKASDAHRALEDRATTGKVVLVP
jgi:NADPH2:quinone reductase